MYRKLVLCLFVVLFWSVVVSAQNGDKDKDAGIVSTQNPEKKKDDIVASAQGVDNEKDKVKELSGMSIVGNDEAPKSLYIVPWKSSKLGVETSLDTMLNEGDVPVDRDVFKRQLEFYRISRRK